MTSKSVVDKLARELRFCGEGPGPVAGGTAHFRFVVDGDSSLCWPDLPYDTAAALSRHDLATQQKLQDLLSAAAHVMRSRAPLAFAFVDSQLDRVLLRCTDQIEGASSASHRGHVGSCVLTNLQAQPQALQIAIEGLLHEAIHQHLYRTEAREGFFCDLAEHPTWRSPWTGARLPLHSLVHASFVWFGLLTLWCQLATSAVSAEESAHARSRIAHCLFGFEFLGETLGALSPRLIEGDVLDALRGLCKDACASADFAEAPGALRESLARDAHWPAALVEGGRFSAAGSPPF